MTTRVGKHAQRQGVGERKRTAGDHQWIAIASIRAQRSHARRIEHLNHPRHLQLVRHGEGDHRKSRERAKRLEGERRLLQRAGPGTVGQHDALAGEAIGLLDQAIDLQHAERAHRNPIGRWIGERDRERRLLIDAPAFERESSANCLRDLSAIHCLQDATTSDCAETVACRHPFARSARLADPFAPRPLPTAPAS